MINKLIANIKKTNAPIVVGLDPMLNYVPEHVQKKAFAEYGETLEGAAEAVWQFNKAIVDATYDLIPAVKPQIAMYEQFGVPGMAAYEKTVSLPVKRVSLSLAISNEVISVLLLRRMQSATSATCRWEANPTPDSMRILLRSIRIWDLTA